MNKTNTKTILPKKNTKNTLKYKITKKDKNTPDWSSDKPLNKI